LKDGKKKEDASKEEMKDDAKKDEKDDVSKKDEIGKQLTLLIDETPSIEKAFSLAQGECKNEADTRSEMNIVTTVEALNAV